MTDPRSDAPTRFTSGRLLATRRTTGDTAEIIVARVGAKDIGAIARLGAEEGDRLGGSFNNRPAFADVAAVSHRRVARMRGSCGGGQAMRPAGARASEITGLGSEMAALTARPARPWHDMRIDDPDARRLADLRR